MIRRGRSTNGRVNVAFSPQFVDRSSTSIASAGTP
jgi:hypothetical protein